MATAMPQSRPKLLEEMFWHGDAYPDWDAFNWNHRRFYVINVQRVMGILRVGHSAADDYMRDAEKAIAKETNWARLYRADFRASKIQLYPQRLSEPKYLHIAAVIILAVEQMAIDRKADFDIYKQVGIVPAYYFIDGFDADLLRDLSSRFSRARPQDGDFATFVARQLSEPQPPRLLQEMAHGATVTRDVAKNIARVIERQFDTPKILGDILPAGARGGLLGSKSAASSLIPPQG